MSRIGLDTRYTQCHHVEEENGGEAEGHVHNGKFDADKPGDNGAS